VAGGNPGGGRRWCGGGCSAWPSPEGILAAAHVRTAEFAALIAAWHAGDVKRARELGNRLVPLATALFAEPNPAVIKGVLHAQGRIPSPAVRLPLLPAVDNTVRAALAAAGGLPAEGQAAAAGRG
jgi:4-hydroxy-tetrahydrodipicolinate synthase